MSEIIQVQSLGSEHLGKRVQMKFGETMVQGPLLAMAIRLDGRVLFTSRGNPKGVHSVELEIGRTIWEDVSPTHEIEVLE